MTAILEVLSFGAVISSLASGFNMIKKAFKRKKKKISDYVFNTNSHNVNEYNIHDNDIRITNNTNYNNQSCKNNGNYDSYNKKKKNKIKK